MIQTEAEAAALQSDSTLRPESDRTDRATSPYSAKNMLINIIGTTIGSHTEPGTVALFFWGSPREN